MNGRGNNIDPRLAQFLSRIEKLEEEKKSFSENIKSVYAEVKEEFDGDSVKLLRTLVRVRRMDASARELLQEALGSLAELPLGRAAIEREARA